jgi:hypothetical protein
MLGILLHGGDLSWGDWLFILAVIALIGAAVFAAFAGVIYLISKHWINKRRPPAKEAATPARGPETEFMTNE